MAKEIILKIIPKEKYFSRKEIGDKVYEYHIKNSGIIKKVKDKYEKIGDSLVLLEKEKKAVRGYNKKLWCIKKI